MKKWLIKNMENLDKWFDFVAIRLLFLTLGIYVSDNKIIVGTIDIVCIVFFVIVITCWTISAFAKFTDASKGK
jgi:hypothetical protein